MRQVQDPAQLNDVCEIVVEAKDEAAKPVPNKLRLQSILAEVKDGLQGWLPYSLRGRWFIAYGLWIQ
jgi:hypothetical protein